MGYNYLVKVDKESDFYLLVDGRNDSICFLGERKDFSDHEFWNQYTHDEMFDYADENGATDTRMYWEGSTYITFDSYAVTRDNLIPYLESADDNLNPTKESHQFLYRTQKSSAFGGLQLVDVIVGAKSVGIDEAEVKKFIGELETEFLISDKSYLAIDGATLFASAKRFAENDADVLGWATTLATALAGEENTSQRFADKGNGTFLDTYYADYKGKNWRELYTLLNLFDRDDAPHNVNAIVGEADNFPLADIIAIVKAGHKNYITVRKMLDNGIDGSLASNVA